MGKGRRYVRFMSFKEFMKYMDGLLLVNHTDWRKAAQCTDSVGFCFFDDSVEPEERIEYLTGVVTMECVWCFYDCGMNEAIHEDILAWMEMPLPRGGDA